MPVCLSIYLRSICLYALPACLSDCLSVCLYICLSVRCLFYLACLFHLFVALFCLSVCLPICLFVCLFVRHYVSLALLFFSLSFPLVTQQKKAMSVVHFSKRGDHSSSYL